MSCMHTLVIDLHGVYRYRCTKCDVRFKIASGNLFHRPEPKVRLHLTSREVIHLIEMLELRKRTPEEDHILHVCYSSKVSE